MSHPGEMELALYVSRDLNRFDRIRLQWHLKGCQSCAREAERLARTRSAVRAAATQMPPGLDWDRLSAEMTANIHLGLAAGECIGPARAAQPDRMGWRGALVMAGMTAVLLLAWFLNPPRGREHRQQLVRHTPIQIRTAPGGIELNENGATLMLLHTRGEQTPIIKSSTPGSLRARYVDQDTGQVTINNVYSD